MLTCEIILKNVDILKSRPTAVLQLTKILTNYAKTYKTITVRRLPTPPASGYLTRIEESYTEKDSPLHGRREIDTKSQLYKFKTTLPTYLITTRETLYWYDDYSPIPETTTEEKTIIFQIIGEVSDEELLTIVYSQTSLFDAYHAPLYYVIADLLNSSNELTVKFSEDLVFIEPWNGLCTPYLDPFDLPFLALKKEKEE